MSPNWKPIWARERRRPVFACDDDDPTVDSLVKGPLDLGLYQWGNVPAIDVVNLEKNEKDSRANISLAFIASGDLRNVVRTVNDLPEDYSGKLTIVLNEHNIAVTIRNLILLTLLGTIEDEVRAAELALHFWYSAFLPVEYSLHIMSTVQPLMQRLLSQPSGMLQLSGRSILMFDVPEETGLFMYQMLNSPYAMSEAVDEYRRVKFAPSRMDYHDRAYSVIEPSHRVALEEYRVSGLVLPFGALHAHFNVPNRSLFSPNGLAAEWS